MKLVRSTPRHSLRHRPKSTSPFFDGFFDDFFAPMFHHGQLDHRGLDTGLKVDIYEQDDKIVIDAEMPGIDKKDIKLDVKGKLLTLGGERKSTTEVKDENCYRRERHYGTFERTFSLPFEIDADTVAAKYENGILRLEIPKPQEQAKKLITIN